MPTSELATVGDFFLLGLRPGTTLDERDRALLHDLRPAGVILFKSNFLHDAPYQVWLDTHAALIRAVREAVGRERLLIAIDHEGGRVCRTPPPVTRFAPAARWADRAGLVGAGMGRELASLGVNLNFAPVLDIHSNPANPVIGDRAFGTTADTVIASSLAYLSALEQEGVRACGKHFPGHGDTGTDSHVAMPVVDLPLAALERRELRPFAAAIAAGIGMVMTSHVLFRAIDPHHPVTLSRAATHDLLRRHLGFDGVIVSDDCGMHAMDGFLDEPDAIVPFFNAGNDMMMLCAHWTDTERVRGFAAVLVRALAQGHVEPQAMAQSRARIQRFLSRTAMHEVQALAPADFERHRQAGPLFAAETAEVI